eukprot:CFRG5373T1
MNLLDRDRRRGGGGRDRGRGRYVSAEEEDALRTTCSLYVGGIPYRWRERDVEDLFDPFGRVATITVTYDRDTGQNKGFAFVTFEDRRDAEDAYDELNGENVDGRRIRLDWDAGLRNKTRIPPPRRRSRSRSRSPPRRRSRSRSRSPPRRRSRRSPSRSRSLSRSRSPARRRSRRSASRSRSRSTSKPRSRSASPRAKSKSKSPSRSRSPSYPRSPAN